MAMIFKRSLILWIWQCTSILFRVIFPDTGISMIGRGLSCNEAIYLYNGNSYTCIGHTQICVTYFLWNIELWVEIIMVMARCFPKRIWINVFGKWQCHYGYTMYPWWFNWLGTNHIRLHLANHGTSHHSCQIWAQNLNLVHKPLIKHQ